MLIIDDNSVYEIDEECIQKKKSAGRMSDLPETPAEKREKTTGKRAVNPLFFTVELILAEASAVVATSAAAEEKQDDPQAVISTSASVIGSAESVVATTAAQ